MFKYINISLKIFPTKKKALRNDTANKKANIISKKLRCVT